MYLKHKQFDDLVIFVGPSLKYRKKKLSFIIQNLLCIPIGVLRLSGTWVQYLCFRSTKPCSRAVLFHTKNVEKCEIKVQLLM